MELLYPFSFAILNAVSFHCTYYKANTYIYFYTFVLMTLSLQLVFTPVCSHVDICIIILGVLYSLQQFLEI